VDWLRQSIRGNGGVAMGDNSKATQKVPEVFISHSSRDVNAVREIAKGLNDQGIATWYSTDHQGPSTRKFTDNLAEKHALSPFVLGVLSKNSEGRWVEGELSRALRHQKLMLVAIDGDIETIRDNLPMNFELEHIEDLIHEKSPVQGKGWQKLVDEARNEIAKWIERNRELSAADARDEPGDDLTEKQKEPSEPAIFSAKYRKREGIASILEKTVPASAKEQSSGMPPDTLCLSEEALPARDKPLELGLATRDWCCLNTLPLLEKALAANEALTIHEAARAGQGDAQAIVGLAHMLGLDPFAEDIELAGRWLQKASNADVARAMAELAVLIASKKFGKFDLERIDTLSAKAALTDCPRAKTYRALLRFSGTRLPTLSFNESLKLLETAHKEGDPLASTHFGWSLLRGRGIRRDTRRGLTILQDAANAGEARACSYLGIAYGEGRGVERDPERAVHWFKRAKSGGDLLGEFQYAWSHEVGYGTARDAREAQRLYRDAADRGDERAMVRLAQMLLDGRGSVADPAKAVELLKQAVTQDDADARAVLGELYLEGRGTERDIKKAVELLEDASEDDQPRALWTLGKLYEAGSGVTRDREGAESLFRRAAFSATDREMFYAAKRRLDLMGAPLRKPGS